LLVAAHVRVHLLATAPVSEKSAVRRVISATGGQFIEQPDAARWAAALRQLLRAAQPDALDRSPLRVEWDRRVGLAPRDVNLSNRTWPKLSVEPRASAVAPEGTRRVMAAEHRVGLGRVAAVAWSATADEAAAIARL